MQSTVLERILIPERVRRRTNQSTLDGFSVPHLQERPLEENCEPILVTNMSGSWLETKVSRTRGVARFGYTDCPLEREGQLFRALMIKLEGLSEQRGWGIVHSGLSEAVGTLRGLGYVPRSLVVPYGLLDRVCGQNLDRSEADSLVMAQGFVSIVDGIQVLPGDTPQNKGLVSAAPSMVGFYSRIYDHVGVMITRASSALGIINVLD